MGTACLELHRGCCQNRWTAKMQTPAQRYAQPLNPTCLLNMLATKSASAQSCNSRQVHADMPAWQAPSEVRHRIMQCMMPQPARCLPLQVLCTSCCIAMAMHIHLACDADGNCQLASLQGWLMEQHSTVIGRTLGQNRHASPVGQSLLAAACLVQCRSHLCQDTLEASSPASICMQRRSQAARQEHVQ